MRQLSAVGALTGSAVFVLTVGILQAVQTDYDPVEQLMSELALGAHGSLMLIAFLAMAVALVALAWGLAREGANDVLPGCLAVAAAGFVGAGIFPLGATTEIHVGLVAVAFVAAGVAMALLPGAVSRFGSPRCRWISWFLGAAMAASVALGHAAIPIGVAQRLAATALLAWIVLCAVGLARR